MCLETARLARMDRENGDMESDLRTNLTPSYFSFIHSMPNTLEIEPRDISRNRHLTFVSSLVHDNFSISMFIYSLLRAATQLTGRVHRYR